LAPNKKRRISILLKFKVSSVILRNLAEGWAKLGRDQLTHKIQYIRDNFNLHQHAQGVGNKIMILLLLVIAYLLWQIYTLQSALIT